MAGSENNHQEIKCFDSVLLNPSEDRLGYSEFSKRFAKTIATSITRDSYVVALTGDWGSGKSSILNFIEYYLTSGLTEIGLSEKESPLILHFNPWVFSGRDDILQQFFSQIKIEFHSEDKRGKFPEICEKLSSLIDDLSSFGLMISAALPDNIKSAVLVGCAGVKTVKSVSSNTSPHDEQENGTDQRSIYLQKKSITSKFDNLNSRLVIIIDDLDRLTSDEILEIFKAIKAIADFPKTVYILAYDESVILNALDKTMCASHDKWIDIPCAKRYLEKIVQITVPLPPPNEVLKDNFLRESLSAVLQNTEKIFCNDEHWIHVMNSISHFMSTPRRIKRLINNVNLLYPSVENEVNAIDFICLETVRLCLPNLYDLIKKHPEYFIYAPVDDNYSLTRGVNKTEHKEFHERWFDKLDNFNKIPAVTLLFNMFPGIQVSLNVPAIILSYDEGNRVQSARISANENIFRRYFRLEIENYDYSVHEIYKLFSQPFNKASFSSLLMQLQKETDENVGVSKAGIFLNQLYRYLEAEFNFSNEERAKISEEQLKAIIESLFDIGDELMLKTDAHPGFYGRHQNSLVLSQLCRLVLTRFKKQTRLEIFKECLTNGKAISLLCKVFSTSIDMNEADPIGRSIFGNNISQEQRDELKDTLLNRIEEMTLVNESGQSDYSFFQLPNLRLLVVVWRNISRDDEKLDNYIREFFGKDTSVKHAILNSNRFEGHVCLTSLEPTISKDEFGSKIKKILNSNDLTPREKRILSDFLEAT